MSLETQISLMTMPQEFARLCNAVLRAEHGDDFLPIDDDQADAGNDGFLKSQRRMFAMHCFKRAQNQSIEQLIRRKMVGDLGKAIALKQADVWDVDAWTFVSNYPVSEAVAAEVVSIGRRAGIDVSWRGPADLAVALQTHPQVRDLFPALQVNDVSEQLGELHQSVAGLAQELEPPPDDFPKVPRTPEAQARLIATRSAYWEYRLFASALLQGRDALEFSYLDYELGISRRREQVDFDAAIAVINEVYHHASGAAGAIERAFGPAAQRRAFGLPGEAGDPNAIRHMAGQVTGMYADLLEAATQLLSIEPPEVLARMQQIVLRHLRRPIEIIRAFVDKTVEEIERLDEYLAQRRDVFIKLDLTLELDDQVGRELDDEMRRVKRKVRWRNWTGLDVNRH